jgi:hypothetical protein
MSGTPLGCVPAITNHRHLVEALSTGSHAVFGLRFLTWDCKYASMKSISIISAFSLLVSVPLGALAADNTPPAGFVALFNGKDFTNWRVPEGDGGHWKVVDGVIDYDAESQAPGDKNLWSEREFGDFVLHVDWLIKDTPFINPNIPYILPDGTHARDIHGKELRFSLPDSDSGIFLRGDGKNQVNIWNWPIGSGEFYGYRTDRRQPPEVIAAVTPRTQADKPVGQWNRFEITVRGDRVSVVLNGIQVIESAQLPGMAPRGRIALQHHGHKVNGQWASSPSLLQFKNIFIKELE